jgi:uncharacterized protein
MKYILILAMIAPMISGQAYTQTEQKWLDGKPVDWMEQVSDEQYPN